jgi:hypothetical protein
MDSTAVAIASVAVSGVVGIGTPYLSSRAAQRRLELEIRVEKEREVRDVLDHGARVLEAAFWSLDRAHRVGRIDAEKGAALFSDAVTKRLPAVSQGGARLAVRLGTRSGTVEHFDQSQRLLRVLAERVQLDEVNVVDLVTTTEWEQAVAAQKRYLDSAQRTVGLPASEVGDASGPLRVRKSRP